MADCGKGPSRLRVAPNHPEFKILGKPRKYAKSPENFSGPYENTTGIPTEFSLQPSVPLNSLAFIQIPPKSPKSPPIPGSQRHRISQMAELHRLLFGEREREGDQNSDEQRVTTLKL